MLFFSDLAIVLKKIPAGEKNELVILLTKEHGKMAFMAYGSRDPKSKKSGSLQLFNTIDFQARTSRAHMPAIKEVKVMTARAGRIFEARSLHPSSGSGRGTRPLAADDLERNIFQRFPQLNAYFRACEIVKLMDGLTKDSQGGGKGFSDLEAALDHVDAPGVTLIFWIRLLSDFGFLPDFRTCAHCHVKINLQDTIQFSTENRGFAHQQCCQDGADMIREALKNIFSREKGDKLARPPTGAYAAHRQSSRKEVFQSFPEDTGILSDSSIFKAMVYFQRATIEEAVRVKMSAVQMKKIKEILERIEL